MHRNTLHFYLLEHREVLTSKFACLLSVIFLPIKCAISQIKNKETVSKSLHACHVSSAISKSVEVLNTESLLFLLNFKMLNQCYFHIGLA